MSLYPNCRMETFCVGWEYELQQCEVRIGNGTIAVSYGDSAEGFTVYKGKESSSGHFNLRADNIHGYGTLHLDKEQGLLEGSWHEEGAEGMWRIELG